VQKLLPFLSAWGLAGHDFRGQKDFGGQKGFGGSCTSLLCAEHPSDSLSLRTSTAVNQCVSKVGVAERESGCPALHGYGRGVHHNQRGPFQELHQVRFLGHSSVNVLLTWFGPRQHNKVIVNSVGLLFSLFYLPI